MLHHLDYMYTLKCQLIYSENNNLLNLFHNQKNCMLWNILADKYMQYLYQLHNLVMHNCNQ